MEKVKLGQIVNVTGLKGEVKVYNYSDSDESYRNAEKLYIGKTPYNVQNVRMSKNMVILKLEGIDDRNGAESVRGQDVFILESELPQLPENQYYIKDLIGLKAISDEGDTLGKVTNVIQNTGQDVYEIKMENNKRILIPGVPEFLLKVEIKKKLIVFHLPDGIMDLQY